MECAVKYFVFEMETVKWVELGGILSVPFGSPIPERGDVVIFDQQSYEVVSRSFSVIERPIKNNIQSDIAETTVMIYLKSLKVTAADAFKE